MRNPASLKAAPAKSPRPARPDYPHQAAVCPNYPDLDTSREHGKACKSTDGGGEMVQGVPPTRASVPRGRIGSTRSHWKLASMACGPVRVRLGHRELRSARLGRMVGNLWRCADRLSIRQSAARIKHPRTALRAFARRWLAAAKCMQRGRAHPTVRIGARSEWPTLGPLLRARAKLLVRGATDDKAWRHAL
jgi:hypothetical protein